MSQSLDLLVLFVTIIQLNFSSCAFFGESCRTHKDACVGSTLGLHCEDGVCRCNNSSVLKYTKEVVAYCSVSPNYVQHEAPSKACGNCTKHQLCNDLGFCECKSQYINIENNCYNYVLRKPMKLCFVKNLAHICDHRKFSYCKDSVCVCFSGYNYNYSTGKCTKKLAAADLGNTNSHCTTSSDCSDGLICQSNFTCSCPSFGTYNEIRKVCIDEQFETPSAIIITGILLSVVSITFWGCFIRKALQKAKLGGNSESELDESPIRRTPAQYENNTFNSVYPTQPQGSQHTNNDRSKRKPCYSRPPPSYLEAISTGPSESYLINHHASPSGSHSNSYSPVVTTPLDTGTSQVPTNSTSFAANSVPTSYVLQHSLSPPPYNSQDPLLDPNIHFQSLNNHSGFQEVINNDRETHENTMTVCTPPPPYASLCPPQFHVK